MAEQSEISWTHATFNPWRGCTKVSDGCKNCYAETMSKRNPGVLGVWGDNGTRVIAVESYWKQPLKWNRDAARAGERRRVFCSSLADVFEDRSELEAPRRRLFKLIQATPNLDWLLLTKRPENIHKLTYRAIDPFDDPDCDFNAAGDPNGLDVADFGELYPNVWLGATVENQEQADRRIPELLKIPATVRFLSCEPLLGPVQLGIGGEFFDYGLGEKAKIDWVIAGGESGLGARPFDIEWSRNLRNQCAAAGVSFFLKQLGSNAVGKITHASPKPVALNKEGWLRDKKGGNWDEWPEDLRVREMPHVS